MFYYRHYEMRFYYRMWPYIVIGKFIYRFSLYLTRKIVQIYKVVRFRMQEKETLKQEKRRNLQRKMKGVHKNE